jgi:MFS family permease
LLVFLKDLSFFSAVMVPFFTDWGGLQLFHIQLIQSWFAFWCFVMEVPTGVIADHFGRKHSIVLGALLVSLAAVLYGSIPHLAVFLVAEFIWGTSIALISGADNAWLFDTLKEQKLTHQSEQYFGREQSFKYLGMLVAAPLGGIIAKLFALNFPMLFSAIPFFLASLVALTLKEPQRSSSQSQSPHYLKIAKDGLLFLKNHRHLKKIAFDAALVSSVAYFVLWFHQPVLMELNLPIIYFGLFTSVMLISEIVISGNFTFFEKKFKFISYPKLSAILTTLGFLIVGLFPHLITALLFVILAGGFGMTRFAYLTAQMNRYIPSDKRATINSSISMLRRLALVIVNPLMGMSADRSLRTTLVILGLIPALVLFRKQTK